ncbi:1-acyl-sn-glycerol-3-phosphate acyltransferase gamma-like [Antechinus flavipes]|uniref:1-acyl-sn-glycerol-3-phosphate acyltransferase gamma-like n=1 Tax=Antechinus flavipes TaxID=38775 RepID=UPI00223668E9|nr:1-acyl-sn-glycerol-3-phosphate acyltransferase gamma-like [Antechinus flavipes]
MGALSLPGISAVVLSVFGLVFICSGLVVNCLQLASLVFWPLSRKFYRKVNSLLGYSLHCHLVTLLAWWSGSECTLFTKRDSLGKIGKETAIVIFNHTFEIDLFCLWILYDRYGILGTFKVMAKKELLWVPVIGWTTYFMESVFCERKWEQDQVGLVKSLSRLADFPEPFGFAVFCEGTRFTQEKHRVSMEVARAKGLPRLKYHLLPRTKGFAVAVRCLRGRASAVYDVTLNFRGRRYPTLLGLIRREKYEADMCFRRIPLEEIPLEEQEIAPWLHRLYQEKDALQEFYNQRGTFPGDQVKLGRRPWAPLHFSLWAVVILFSLFKLAVGIFLSGSPLLILIFCGFIGGSFWGVHRLVGVSKIENASAYGNQEFQKRE